MSFSLSISLFFVVTVFYIVIIDVFTMLFRITGLTEEKAKFQVISLLTNSGYSTAESELVVGVLPRRRIARTIMLFGYVFSITIVSVFVNMMVALPASEQREIWPALIVVSVLFVIFMFVRRIPVVRMAFNSVLERFGRKVLYRNQDNPIMLQDEYPRGNIATVTLNTLPPLFKDKTLSQIQLREKYGVHIFYLRRDGVIDLNVNGSTILQPHDDVTVFGKKENIHRAFEATASTQAGPKAARPESEAEFIRQEDAAAGAPVQPAAKTEAPRPASPAESAPASGGTNGSGVREFLEKGKDDIKRAVDEIKERREEEADDPARSQVKAVRKQKLEQGETKLATAIVDGVEKSENAIEKGTVKLEEHLEHSLERSLKKKSDDKDAGPDR